VCDLDFPDLEMDFGPAIVTGVDYGSTPSAAVIAVVASDGRILHFTDFLSKHDHRTVRSLGIPPCFVMGDRTAMGLWFMWDLFRNWGYR